MHENKVFIAPIGAWLHMVRLSITGGEVSEANATLGYRNHKECVLKVRDLLAQAVFYGIRNS